MGTARIRSSLELSGLLALHLILMSVHLVNLQCLQLLRVSRVMLQSSHPPQGSICLILLKSKIVTHCSGYEATYLCSTTWATTGLEYASIVTPAHCERILT